MEDNTVEIYTNNDNNIYINQNKIDNDKNNNDIDENNYVHMYPVLNLHFLKINYFIVYLSINIFYKFYKKYKKGTDGHN